MTSGSICEAQRAPSPHQNGPIVQLRGTSGPLPRHMPSHVEQECVHLAVSRFLGVAGFSGPNPLGVQLT